MPIPFLVLLSFLSLPAHAALDCASLKAKLASLNPEKKDWKEVSVPAAEASSWLEALPSPFAPSAKELSARLKKMRAAPEAEFPAYLADNYANCTMRRAELRMALLNTAASLEKKSKERKKISKEILSTLKSEKKFPTLISALADARILEHGVEKGVWQSKDDLEIRLAHEKIRAELAEENKAYGEPWGQVAKGLESGNLAEKGAFLKGSEAWKQVRAHVLAEPEESASHLRKLRALASRLRAN